MSLNLSDADGDEEPLHLRVEPDHEVDDADKDDGGHQEDGQLCQLLSDEVDVSPIHPIEMFPEKDWQLHTDDVDDSEHVGEGHVGDDQELGKSR